MTTAETAKALAEGGFAVFPCKTDGTPATENGFKDATLDPWYAQEWFEKHPNALIGVYTALSRLIVLDIDLKTADDGTVKDGFDSLDSAFLDTPETYAYTSRSGNGRHLWYQEPEDGPYGRAPHYRGMDGVDRCSGEGYAIFNGDHVPSRDELAAPPEWLLDKRTPRAEKHFTGTTKEWYDSLQPGEPNAPVRKAMERAQAMFEASGNDMTHSDLIERSFEAIRLGAEGNPGVVDLLDLLEDLAVHREGPHSRTPDEYASEFQEGLVSGIAKYGDMISELKELPAWDSSAIPTSVPDSLFFGTPGDADDFRILLRALWTAFDGNEDKELQVASVLWHSPRTRDISREWGFEFVLKRVREARVKPEPRGENPSLEQAVAQAEIPDEGFLTPEEKAQAEATDTFIDTFVQGSALKGFSNPHYDVPAAWTALSMAHGGKALIPYSGALGVNLWFIQLGPTGSGKSKSKEFAKSVLDVFLREEGSYYNVGADSSPAAIHEELLLRDGKPSMILHDEAASFFSELRNTQWVKSLEHHFSAFYDGSVEPSNKIRLPAELRGKHAETSFNLWMLATQDKMTDLITTSMFDTGFLSRVNWTWSPDRADDDDRYLIEFGDIDTRAKSHPVVYRLGMDLLGSMAMLPERIQMTAEPEALQRLSAAFKAFDQSVRSHERYEVLRGPVVRLSETLLKCAALTALYRGDDEITMQDALVSILHCEEWLRNMIRVVASVSESEFSRDVTLIESHVRAKGGSVTKTSLLHTFRHQITRSPRELDDRIDFLVSSGRLWREVTDNSVKLHVNGG